MEVQISKGVRTELIVTLIGETDQELKSLELLNEALRSGATLGIHHHVEDEEGVRRVTMESHSRSKR